MKVVLIGTNHAGIAAANTLLDQYEGIDLVMIDRNSNLSYLGCGTALWVGRQIDGYDKLFYAKEEDFKAKGAQIYLETTVDRVDYEQQQVYATDQSGEVHVFDYDKLILATGSLPITPQIPGNDLEGLYFLKLFQEGQALDHALQDPAVESVAVIGAGYIGVEIAEAMQRRGKKVTLFDAASTTLSNYYDPEFARLMDQNLKDHGIDVRTDEWAEEYIGNEDGHVCGLKTNRGEYSVDLVVNSIGFIPNASLAGDHLKTFDNGAYLVDRTFKTRDDNVYAIGDCANNYSNALQSDSYIALASNAVRSGIVAAHNIGGTHLEGAGIQGSNGICIYDFKMVSTGLSVKAAKEAGIDVAYVDYEDLQFPNFIPENYTVKIRLTYDRATRRLLGAQLASEYDVSMAIHMFSLAIQEELTIDKLSLLDIFFLPHFNQPYNYMTVAALKAE